MYSVYPAAGRAEATVSDTAGAVALGAEMIVWVWPIGSVTVSGTVSQLLLLNQSCAF